MPHIIGVVGNLGAGKTTTASMMGWLYKNKIEKRGGHVQLFANYDLYGAERMKVANDWFKVAEAHGSICVWDEAHRSFDSRKSLRFENTLATDLLTFVRKMASIQIFATPSINRLDTRIRDMLEVLIHVRPMGNKGVVLDYYDFQADSFGPKGQFLHSRHLGSGKLQQIHKLSLFDTHSFVGGFPLPKTEREADVFMEQLEKVHDEARRKKHANNRTSK
ncbi:ATP-binding protein [Paenibacillus sp. EKM102P]|uniref:ATP-binding protein n=1 Tax=unclassified Paenibacillus TaxID=185978 RepID=UPI00142DC449|nr:MULTISPECIES: ATP-binding protein [unclassified Paenibacillus]KAF6614224.1 ATP-binding protein [Paenibacillus sp. EKM101P]KAF6616582.1 ATP-binding protein [Paenibacillus sp. EKM102P]KAF6625044.1 ATP-binding protein [Paenibacillus sp. EKM10P]KAF6640874.1 ATP-binding protein [Paenibacillus sp. EKM11P]